MVYSVHYFIYRNNMSQNPWKQQQMANKTNPSPVAQGGKSLPPWMKNKAPEQPPPSEERIQTKTETKAQPPWMKGKAEQPSNQSPREVKNESNPPWMKKQPSGATTPQNKNVPAWMKKGGKTPEKSPRFQEQKRAQEQAKRVEEEKRQKEEQQLREKQQKQRKQQDERIRLQEQQRLRIEEQEQKLRIHEQQKLEKQKAQKLQEEKKQDHVESQEQGQQSQPKAVRKPIKQRKSSPKKKEKSSAKKKQVQQDSLLMKYLSKLQQSCDKELDYNERIENQKQLFSLINQFASESQKTIEECFQQKKVQLSKNSNLNLPETIINFALIEARTEQNQTTFAHQNQVNLRKKFKVYNIVNNIVIKWMKKITQFRIRVPLLCYLEHKGIEYMCESVCEEVSSTLHGSPDSYPEITGELLQVERELKQINCWQKDMFSVKKLYLNDEQIYFLYLNQAPLHEQPLTLQSLLAITEAPSSQHLFSDSTYLSSQLQSLQNTSTQTMQKIIQQLKLAHAIKLVYGSCQGQIHEQSFWQLLFSGNKDIWTLVQHSYRGLYRREMEFDCVPQFGMMLMWLEWVLPVRFQSDKGEVKVSGNSCRQTVYSFCTLETVQICNNFNKYLQSGKQDLANYSLDLQSTLHSLANSLLVPSLQLTQNRIHLHLTTHNTSDFQTLFQGTQNYPYHCQHILLLKLMMSILMKQQMEMLQTIQQLLQLLSDYHQIQIWTHATIYSIVASYYSQQGKHQEANKFMQHACNISSQIFGNRSIQYANILLQKAQTLLNLDEDCNVTVEEALKIYKNSSKHTLKIVECWVIQAKLKLKNKDASGYELMHRAIQEYLHLEQPNQAMNLYLYLMEEGKEHQQQLQPYLEQIVSIGFTYKQYQPIRQVITTLLRQQLTTNSHQAISEVWHNKQQMTVDEGLMGLQSQSRNFGSFTEMLKWSINSLTTKENQRAHTILSYITPLIPSPSTFL